MASFFGNYCYMHMYTYSYKFLNISSSLCIMLLECMPLGLTICYWINNWCAFPSGSLSHSQHPSVACSCVGLKPSEFFSINISMSTDVVLVQLMCRRSCQTTAGASDIHRRYNHTTNSLLLWL